MQRRVKHDDNLGLTNAQMDFDTDNRNAYRGKHGERAQNAKQGDNLKSDGGRYLGTEKGSAYQGRQGEVQRRVKHEDNLGLNDAQMDFDTDKKLSYKRLDHLDLAGVGRVKREDNLKVFG